jgi:hypothetical protein
VTTPADVFGAIGEAYPELAMLRVEMPAALYPDYAGRPVEFVKDVLHQSLTPQQAQILEGLERAPYRVLAKAGHNVGKTMAAACAVLYWHLTRSPCIIITTAPKLEQVRDLLWKEIRRLAPAGLVQFAGPKALRIERAADDFAAGTTAREGVGFAGHHGPSLLFIFDEAVGVEDQFWEVAETMFGGHGHAWLCLFNPTDTASRAYREEHADRPAEEGWTVVTLSCLEHPNIVEELAGRAPPIPAAVRLRRLTRMLTDWSDPIRAEDATATDLYWPPDRPCSCKLPKMGDLDSPQPVGTKGTYIGSSETLFTPDMNGTDATVPCPRCDGTGVIRGTWLKPGPIAECRLLGRWPSQSFYSVWGDRLWSAACEARLDWTALDLPVIACDVARFGDDNSAIHCRRASCSYHHEEHNGWDGVQVASRLKELAREGMRDVTPDWDKAEPEWRERVARKATFVVDDTGGIGEVYGLLARDGWNVIPINSSWTAHLDLEYGDIRSELWFNARGRAKRGELDLHRLPERVRAELRTQAMAQTWKVDGDGRRLCHPKDVIKKELKRSPDGLDALNLAYYSVGAALPQVVERQAKTLTNRDSQRERARRRLFG